MTHDRRTAAMRSFFAQWRAAELDPAPELRHRFAAAALHRAVDSFADLDGQAVEALAALLPRVLAAARRGPGAVTAVMTAAGMRNPTERRAAAQLALGRPVGTFGDLTPTDVVTVLAATTPRPTSHRTGDAP